MAATGTLCLSFALRTGLVVQPCLGSGLGTWSLEVWSPCSSCMSSMSRPLSDPSNSRPIFVDAPFRNHPSPPCIVGFCHVAGHHAVCQNHGCPRHSFQHHALATAAIPTWAASSLSASPFFVVANGAFGAYVPGVTPPAADFRPQLEQPPRISLWTAR